MNAQTTIVISAERHERFRQFLRDLWDYRELFVTFLERDLKVRYKQTALGVLWVVLQPLLVTGAFALIFGRIAGMPTDGLPYVLFYLAALVPWTTFAASVTQSALSMETNASLISKVYFPRAVVPGAVVCASMLDYAIGSVMLNVVAIGFGAWDWRMVALAPFLLLIQVCTALGYGLPLAVLNAQYRDIKHAIGFLVQLLMLGSPIIYPASRLPEWLRDWLWLNPMAAVITTYRACLSHAPVPWSLLMPAALMALLLVVAGAWFFRSREVRLADIL